MLKNILHSALNLVLPIRCLGCDVFLHPPGINSGNAVCFDCFANLSFLTDPQCSCCGYPFDYDNDQELCLACLKNKPLYRRAKAALRYDDFSRLFILKFKYADQTHACDLYTRWLIKAGEKCLKDVSMITPVPLYWVRLWQRRYNQSALLAKHLATLTSLKYIPNLLIRSRSTLSQGNMSNYQRQKNVKNAFTFNSKYKHTIQGKHILLIDDVFTTGATVLECTKTLLNAGAANVDILTLARVV
ncbi:MAG: ComF family protein [Alphaproteobacteria bacterium]|nr:ComF family protein [Alphaproteobacteria bacterium]